MANCAVKMVGADSLNYSELGQYELTLFLCGLQALDFGSTHFERHLSASTIPPKPRPYREVVSSIANLLFVEGGSKGEVGYAVLELITDTGSFSLVRYNNRLKELLGPDNH